MLSRKEKQEYVSSATQKYKKSNNPLYILYKDYNDFDSTLYSKGELNNIVSATNNTYGIATSNKQYMHYLVYNGFKLLYKA